MKHIQKTEINFEYTDGSRNIRPADFGLAECAVDDGITRAKVQKAEGDAGEYEYTVSIEALSEKPLKFVDIQFVLSEDFNGSGLLVFCNGTTTNDAAQVNRFSEMNGAISHDLCLMKNTEINGILNFAMVSADRFFAYFQIESVENCVRLRYSMEDKPLEPGKKYILEEFMLSETLESEEFLRLYTDKLLKRYPRPLKKEIPSGYCSWSCYYHDVDEKKMSRAGDELIRYFADKNPRLVQIDDGWQKGPSFAGSWVEDKKKFPKGLTALSEKLGKLGISFGLWLAPFLVGEDSEYYKQYEKLTATNPDGSPAPSYKNGEIPVYPLRLDENAALDAISDNFRRAHDEYKSSYFKLDFLICSLLNSLSPGKLEFVKYGSDYSVAVYRKALKKIRGTVGNDSFLLACGAPITESAGIFDGIRVTPDIVWGKNKNLPSGWEIVKFCSRSLMLRYFYHDSLFINDPDGVVVRDYDINDGHDATYAEARLWATEVAMSGGSVLINEEMERLGGSRRELFSQILPVYGKSARPLDFFELPQPSTLCLDIDESTKIVSVFNWVDKMTDKKIDLCRVGFNGSVMAVKCWEKEAAGVFEGSIDITDMMPHSAMVFLIRELPLEPAFLFADGSLYSGADVYSGHFSDNVLKIRANDRFGMCGGKFIYIYVPDGFKNQSCETVISEEKWKVIRTAASKQTEIHFKNLV